MGAKPGTGKKRGGKSLQPEPGLRARLAVCVKAIDDKRGEEIVVLDLQRQTIVDYFLIATAQSARALKATAEAVVEALRKAGFRVPEPEGTPASGWVLVDAGDFVVHLFQPAQRRFYDLELMWGDAPRIKPDDLLAMSHEP